MQKYLAVLGFIGLSACGTMGIGKNNVVNVFNNTSDTVVAYTDAGSVKIKPESNVLVSSKKTLMLKSENNKCTQVSVEKQLNGVALVLDIFPGLLFGVIPVVVDAITGGLDNMPESYFYDC